jgi:hypothetical protein
MSCYPKSKTADWTPLCFLKLLFLFLTFTTEWIFLDFFVLDHLLLIHNSRIQFKFFFFNLLDFLFIFYSYFYYYCVRWGYIGVFSKVLTMYQICHIWICPLRLFSFHPSPRNPGTISTSIIFAFAHMCIHYLDLVLHGRATSFAERTSCHLLAITLTLQCVKFFLELEKYYVFLIISCFLFNKIWGQEGRMIKCFQIQFSNFIFYFFLFCHFYIYSHVYTLFGPSHTPLTPSCIRFCWRENISDNKKDIIFLLVEISIAIQRDS